jgi:hypothetical protein
MWIVTILQVKERRQNFGQIIGVFLTFNRFEDAAT